MSQGIGASISNARRDLVERVAASPYLARSARLKDLLLYLSERVLGGDASEIHEQEVGHKVFGRPFDYDTASDNIVRVHASTLRKRLDQYFAAEGAAEPLIIEIPRGNYAPVFRERPRSAPSPPTVAPEPRRVSVWPRIALATLLVVSAMAALVYAKLPGSHVPNHHHVRLFWSRLIAPGAATNIVLDDSAVALYQELTGKRVALSEYFDRSYLRGLSAEYSSLVLHRQSSFAATSFAWRIAQIPEMDARWTSLRFARDFAFRDLKTGNAILLGNANTNPWIQPFEARLGIRWEYDSATSAYHAVDTRNPGATWESATSKNAHNGFVSLAMLPNLAHTGNVLIVSGTGGSALNAAAGFLADDRAMGELEAKIGSSHRYFEALMRMNGRSTLSRDAAILVFRTIEP